MREDGKEGEAYLDFIYKKLIMELAL